MLATTAPFPHAGCHALILVDPGDPARAHGERATPFQATAYVAVRVLRYVDPFPGGAARSAVVSLVAVDGASGQRAVSPTVLRDATPLTADERAELTELEARITGRSRVPRKLSMRHEELAERAELAPILARQLRRAAASGRASRTARQSMGEKSFA